MKVLVTGSRAWTDIETVYERLSQLPSGSIVVHGACEGADTIAHAVAEQLGFTVRPYPARWKELGKRAGPIRNQHMLVAEHLPHAPIELCLAFHDDLPNSRGTKDMVGRASDADIEVRVVKSCVSSQQDDSDTRGTPSS